MFRYEEGVYVNPIYDKGDYPIELRVYEAKDGNHPCLGMLVVVVMGIESYVMMLLSMTWSIHKTTLVTMTSKDLMDWMKQKPN